MNTSKTTPFRIVRCFFFRTGLVGARSCQAMLAYGRKGSRLGAEAPASARISPRGSSAEPVGHWGARQSSPSSVGHKARWTATPRRPHQRRRHPAAAAVQPRAFGQPPSPWRGATWTARAPHGGAARRGVRRVQVQHPQAARAPIGFHIRRRHRIDDIAAVRRHLRIAQPVGRDHVLIGEGVRRCLGVRCGGRGRATS
mgnify:CR=1 FL=1